MAQSGWLIDLGRCIGCHSCTVACKAEQNTAPVNSPLLFKGGNPQRPLHVSYRWVVVQEGGTYPNVWRTFVTTACNHCQTPACLNGCPVNAISKRASDGIVLIDQEKCIGCKYCVWACPYGAPQWNEAALKVEKCTMCVERIDKGLQPACATTCVGKALAFVPDFNVAQSGQNAPDGFADPAFTKPSTRFGKK
jgi:Fe-S-cluster-containing dehydrogenase component